MLERKNPNEMQLRSLVEMFAAVLPAANIADAKELITHGEYGEALELICTQLYEYEAPVSSDAYKIIEECGRRMLMDESSWSFLRELRAHPTSKFDEHDKCDKYETMQKEGRSPVDAYREALHSGLGKIQAIRMLRSVFAMSLEEAMDLVERDSRPPT